MTMNEREVVIDVRTLVPRERHPTIFRTWDELGDQGSLVIINDHDPLPLYYQFAAEAAGGFHWEYHERGPEVWRVRIQKGKFDDPGFRPQRGERGSCRVETVPIAFVQPSVLDVRPILERGATPCGAIEEAVARLIPGQSLVILAPFEPVPLYTKLGNCGFGHETRQLEDGTWRIEFRPEAGAESERFEACGCHEH